MDQYKRDISTIINRVHGKGNHFNKHSNSKLNDPNVPFTTMAASLTDLVWNRFKKGF